VRVVPRVVIVSPSEHKSSFRSEQRLHRPGEFSAVMAARRVVRGTCFDLHFRPANIAGKARIGLIVPKRLARAAVLRNAIKRQGREAFRMLASAIQPYDLVLRLTRPIQSVSAKDGVQRKIWRAEIETLLRHFLT
jgi:ribonuclease P protein component